VAERGRRAAEEAGRREREQALERRSWRRLRALVAVLAVAAAVAGGLSALAMRQTDRLHGQVRVTTARELAAEAVASLDIDPERSILLALEAVETTSVDGTVLPEAEEALHHAVASSRIVLSVPGAYGRVAWSPDGQQFVTEGPEDSGIIDVRDADTGASLRSWHGHDVDVNDVAFSPDGALLATTGDDGAARIWDPVSGRELGVMQGPPDVPVFGPSFSTDGTRVAAAWSTEGLVRVLDLASGEVSVFAPRGPPSRTAFSPDGTTLAVALEDVPGSVVVVDATTGDEIMTLDGHAWPVTDVRWSPDGQWIASASWDATARVWEAEAGAVRFTLHGHTSGVTALDWSPDGARLATGSSDGTAKVWEVTAAGTRELFTLAGHDTRSGIWGVAFSPDGSQLMTGAAVEESVQIWDVRPTGGGQWGTFPAAALIPSGIAFTADDELVTVDDALRIWDVATGTESRTAELREHVSEVEASPDGTQIAGVAAEAAIVWDAASGHEVFALTLRGAAASNGVAWSPEGTWLAFAESENGRIVVVDRAWREVTTLEDSGFELRDLAFSPDGDLLAAASWFRDRIDLEATTVKIWDWRRGEVVREIDAAAEAVAFDPSGERIATAGWGGLGQIWDVAGGEVVALVGHAGTIFDIAFAPDGSRVATAGFDGTVRLWEPDTGRQQLVLLGHEAAVFKARFSPDGTRLASSSPDGTARVWALDLDDLVALAKGKLTREFTDEECRQYLQEACDATTR
jgi:WD40 repeat protein